MVELSSIEKQYNAHGFTGCVCAVDCSKIKWKNCPLAEKGQYHNKKEETLATIQVEALCDLGNLYLGLVLRSIWNQKRQDNVVVPPFVP